MSCHKVEKEASQNDILSSYDITSNYNIETNEKEDDNKKLVNYSCDLCNYNTRKKYNYEKHMSSQKHLEIVKNAYSTVDYKFNCVECNYHTNIRFSYDKHKMSSKHKNKIMKNINISENGIELKKDIFNNDVVVDSIMSEIKTLMMEQQKQIQEQNKIISEIANNQQNMIVNHITNNNNNNHTNNHQFNMNMFLNETCKDAMNMSEFIENLTVTMEDMEMTGTLGFAKGMSRIIMNNLNALEVHKRPIHCSDAKRETLYVKNNGVWEKDTDDKKHTKELIYKVSSLNLKHLLKWRDLPRNKGYDNPEHKKNDEFTILVMEINKVKVEEIEKVVTIISKNVTIDKNKVRMSGYLN